MSPRLLNMHVASGMTLEFIRGKYLMTGKKFKTFSLILIEIRRF